jgi:hypothetical protein
MKSNHPGTVLWDEVNILIRGYSPFQFTSEFPSQVLVETKVDNQFVNSLCLTAMSLCLSAEMAPMFFFLFLSLDY